MSSSSPSSRTALPPTGGLTSPSPAPTGETISNPRPSGNPPATATPPPHTPKPSPKATSNPLNTAVTRRSINIPSRSSNEHTHPGGDPGSRKPPRMHDPERRDESGPQSRFGPLRERERERDAPAML